jgi:peroxiredoxin
MLAALLVAAPLAAAEGTAAAAGACFSEVDKLANVPVTLAKADPAPRIGATAPAFTLPGLDGESYSMDRFRGKPLVLNFWASWCGPCRSEAPSLEKLQKEFSPALQVVAINLTDADSEKSARQFAAAYGFDFPVLLDRRGSAAESYRIRPVPTTFFIDANGVIQDGVLGALSWEEMRDRAGKLLHSAN